MCLRLTIFYESHSPSSSIEAISREHLTRRHFKDVIWCDNSTSKMSSDETPCDVTAPGTNISHSVDNMMHWVNCSFFLQGHIKVRQSLFKISCCSTGRTFSKCTSNQAYEFNSCTQRAIQSICLSLRLSVCLSVVSHLFTSLLCTFYCYEVLII